MELEETRRVFRGTMEEFEAVRHLFAPAEKALASNSEVVPPVEPPLEHGAEQGKLRLTKEEIRQVLTRRPTMGKDHNHVKLFKAIEDNGNDYTRGSTLLEQLGLEEGLSQLAGVLGSLGRRINQTPGIRKAEQPQTSLELFLEWDKRDGEWCYRMRAELREVLKELGMI